MDQRDSHRLPEQYTVCSGVAAILCDPDFDIREIRPEEYQITLPECLCQLPNFCCKEFSPLGSWDINVNLTEVLEEHSQHDMLICVIVLRRDGDHILGADGSMISTADLYELVGKAFKDKPKIFFFVQFQPGEPHQHQPAGQRRGSIVTDAGSSNHEAVGVMPRGSYPEPKEPDFLVVHVPAYGIYSNKSESQVAAIFVRHLIEALLLHGGNEIRSILSELGEKFADALKIAADGAGAGAASHWPTRCGASPLHVLDTLTKNIRF